MRLLLLGSVLAVTFASITLAFQGCSSDQFTPIPLYDGGTIESGMFNFDAAQEGSTDGSVDGGHDAPVDAPAEVSDGAPDAPEDSPSDAPADGTDAATE